MNIKKLIINFQDLTVVQPQYSRIKIKILNIGLNTENNMYLEKVYPYTNNFATHLSKIYVGEAFIIESMIVNPAKQMRMMNFWNKLRIKSFL